MTREELYKVWFEHFVAVLNSHSLKEIERRNMLGSDVITYECPCGEDDHMAVRFFYGDEKDVLSPVLNCFVNDQQWLIREELWQAKIIREEEESYIKLLTRADKVVKKVTAKRGKSPETLHYLWDTHGIAEDIVNDLWSDNIA